MNGTLDVLRYTGEGGKAWPATSGPAEIQLSARQGVPYVPIAGTGTGGHPGTGGRDLRPLQVHGQGQEGVAQEEADR